MKNSNKRDRYRAAIIGLGFIGGADQVSGDLLGQRVSDLDGTHYTAYRDNPRIDIVAGSSRDPGRRSRFAEKSDATIFDDWKRMISEVELDIVSVATYTPVHSEIVIASARAGIPVIYCEKPFARTLAEVDEMIEACNKSGSILVINHQRRFSPTLRKFSQWVAEGNLGDLHSVSTRWPTGRFGNVGTHVFDAVQMILKARPEAVSATLDTTGRPDCRGEAFRDPGGWGIVRYEGGIHATVDAGENNAGPMEATFFGSEGTALMRNRDVDIRLYSGTNQSWRSDGDGSSMVVACNEIVAWLDTSGEFPYSADDARLTHDLITGIHASNERNGAWVELPLTGADLERPVESG